MFKKARHKIRDERKIAKYADHACEQAFDWKWEEKTYNRIALINLLISQTDAKSYLEIGCQDDNLFHSVPVMNKVGVDPARGGNRRMTSDEFFETNTDSFNVIFIDGLHTCEQVRKDVVNAMKCLNPGGWIALHDLLPGNWLEAHNPQITDGAWFGDVWKVGFELAQTEGLDFKIVQIDAGVGVFRIQNPETKLIDMQDEMTNAQFDYFCKNQNILPITEWVDAQSWITS